jgi:D-alanyl-D-alanine dipeptidase
VEGYRSAGVQKRLHDEYRARLELEHPDWTAHVVAAEAALFASPPRLLAPHRTGGAVDVLLLTMRDEVVDMGCQVDATPLDSRNRCFTDSRDIGTEARLARGLLVAAMSDAGFVNYPSEWWHWSYGDQYWAFVTGAPHAVYGAAR